MSLSRRTLFVLLLLCIIAGGTLWFYLRYFVIFNYESIPQATTNTTTTQPAQEIKHEPCLANDEFAGFTTSPKSEADRFSSGPGVVAVTIGLIADPKKNEKLYDLDTFQWDLGRPAEVHKCHIYLMQTVGHFDYKNYKFLTPSGTVSLFGYDYSGKSEKVLDFVRADETGKPIFNFGYEFAVDASETYVALVSPHPDANRHLVVKNIKTGEVVFTAGAVDLAKQYDIDPGIGDINQMNWSNDNKYLHFQLINNIGSEESPTAFELEKDTWKIINVFR